MKTVLGFVEKDNPNAKGADPKSFIDDTLLGEIDTSGFVKGLYQRSSKLAKRRIENLEALGECNELAAEGKDKREETEHE